MKKSIQLLSAAMDGCFKKNSFHGEDKSRWDEAARTLEDLKKLDAALDGVMRSVEKWKLICTVHEYIFSELLVATYISSCFRRQSQSAFVYILLMYYISAHYHSLFYI